MPHCQLPPAVPRRQAGLSRLDLLRLRQRLRRSACSETWVDDQIKTAPETTGDAPTPTRPFFDPSVFPPGGRKFTAMKWCRRCGRYTPAACVQLIERRQSRSGPVISATLQCDDCRLEKQWRTHRELYAAFPNLRPAGSLSFFRLAELISNRNHMK